jgi:hypothetical protein
VTVLQALAAFTLAAGLLTLTPGLDTALVLRTAAVEGPRRAALAVVGILAGCFVWGGLVAFGLGALLSASSLAFITLKWAGAAYLVWLGFGLILKPRDRFEFETEVMRTLALSYSRSFNYLRTAPLRNFGSRRKDEGFLDRLKLETPGYLPTFDHLERCGPGVTSHTLLSSKPRFLSLTLDHRTSKLYR